MRNFYSEGSAREYLRRKYHCTIDLLFDWFGISCMTTDNFCFYLQNKLVQTSQTGGQWYSDTSPFSIYSLVPHFTGTWLPEPLPEKGIYQRLPFYSRTQWAARSILCKTKHYFVLDFFKVWLHILYPSGTVVDHWTLNHKNQGSYPATGIWWEKMVKKVFQHLPQV